MSDTMTSKLPLVLTLGLILSVFGCSLSESDSRTSSSTANADDHSAHDHGDSDGGTTDMEKMNAALVDFSEEDRQAVMKQHFCPVSSQMLGTVGPPEKVDVNGRTVWICCDACKDELMADPSKYLAKLDN